MAKPTGLQPGRAFRDQVTGDHWLNGADQFDAADKPLPQKVTITPAAGGSNVCEVTITIKDARGVAIAGVFNFDVWLSDAATGAGLTGTTASGAVAAKAASGTDLVTLVSKKALRVQSLGTGVYILSITDSAKTGFYVCVQVPGLGKTIISDVLVTGNYG